MVNRDGERFVDEGADFFDVTYVKYGKAILAQPGSIAYCLFDAKLAERELAQRIELYVDAEVEAAFPAHYGAWVIVELRDGRSYEDFELNPHGTPENPCSDEELTQKFKRLASSLKSEEQADVIVGLVNQIDKLDTLRELSAMLRQ